MKPTEPNDYSWLYGLATSPETGVRWRFRGTIPSPEQFVSLLWREVEVQFVLWGRADARRLGLVQLIRYANKDGHAGVSFILDPTAQKSGWAIEGMILFINYVFTTMPIRKLYFESLEFSVNDYSSAIGAFLQDEGTLREHEYFNEKFLDLHISALYRKTWLENRRYFATMLDGLPDSAD